MTKKSTITVNKEQQVEFSKQQKEFSRKYNNDFKQHEFFKILLNYFIEIKDTLTLVYEDFTWKLKPK